MRRWGGGGEAVGKELIYFLSMPESSSPGECNRSR